MFYGLMTRYLLAQNVPAVFNCEVSSGQEGRDDLDTTYSIRHQVMEERPKPQESDAPTTQKREGK